MPSYCYLNTPVPCRHCSSTITDLVMFQWGFSAGFGMRTEQVYLIGDRIRWRRCVHGETPSWTYFEEKYANQSCNFGDPTIPHVLVRDNSFQFYWEQPDERKRCHGCNMPIDGILIEIQNNIIKRAWAYSPHEFDSAVDTYTVEADGSIRPRPEWNDHVMPVRDDC